MVSAFGVESDLPVTNGAATLPVPEIPVYVELAAGQTISVVPMNWGQNLAMQTGVNITASSGSDSRGTGLLNNGALEDWYIDHNVWCWSGSTTFPSWVEVDLPAATTVARVVVYAGIPWQSRGTLIDYELDYDNNGQWVTIERITEPTKTFGVFTPFAQCTVDSFFSDRYNFVHEFSPVTTQKIRLLVYQVSYGGGATAIVPQAGGQANATPTFNLREIEIYGADNLGQAPPFPPAQSPPAASGSGAPTPNLGATASNPVDGTSVTVTGADSGVVQLQVGVSGGAVPAGDSVTTTYYDASGNIVATVQGVNPVYKFTQPGIYVATVTITDSSGNPAGMTKLALPISAAETGQTVTTTPPGSLTITAPLLKGTFLFNPKRKDTVSFKGTIELPAGLDLSQPQTLFAAVGNVMGTVSLNTRGQAKTGANNLLKNVSVKYPRPPKLPKKTTLTGTGQKATVAFTLSAPELDNLGFDAEGISQQGGTAGKSVPRTVQAALVLGGTAYRVDIPVNFKLSKKGNTGQLVMVHK